MCAFDWPMSSRLPAMASTSSKNTMHGAFFLAVSKILCKFFSVLPTYISTMSDIFALMKFDWHSPAAAFMMNVFPHPGGP